jgi:7,8-dihydropterin-6-yl-methyl-4-(beta-D-ribofuranosyl)aminobenzene 5'-phosphate synthase
MKHTISIFIALLIIIQPVGVPRINAQNKPALPKIEITNVYDAFGRESKALVQDFGFSCVINYKGKMILFDSGTDAELFEKNIKALKIDLKKIDVAVVSHGHYDHTGGFDYLLSVNPKVKIYLPNDFFSLGAPIKFPFREAGPDESKTLPKDERYFRGEKELNGMVTVPTGRF